MQNWLKAGQVEVRYKSNVLVMNLEIFNECQKHLRFAVLSTLTQATTGHKRITKAAFACPL